DAYFGFSDHAQSCHESDRRCTSDLHALDGVPCILAVLDLKVYFLVGEPQLIEDLQMPM
ncbi:MAG: hypothetical protein LQ341_007253, partial [Variospora aurantia]